MEQLQVEALGVQVFPKPLNCMVRSSDLSNVNAKTQDLGGSMVKSFAPAIAQSSNAVLQASGTSSAPVIFVASSKQ